MDNTLSGFDAVDAGSSLFGPADLVRGGEVHVPRAGDRHARLRQLIRRAVLAQQGLQLVHRHLKQIVKR